MLTRDDLIDLIVGQIRKAHKPSAPNQPPGSYGKDGPKGRLFLSEYDVKKRLTASGEPLTLTIPRDAILSPLAAEWLALKRAKVVRE